MELTELKGIGPKKASLFHRLGIYTCNDLVFDLPYRYEDRSRLDRIEDIKDGELCLIKAKIISKGRLIRLKGRRSIQDAVFTDETGRVKVTWHNQPYLNTSIRPGQEYYLYGIYDGEKDRIPDPQMVRADDREKLKNFLGIIPVYPLTKGLSQNIRKNAIRSAMESLNPDEFNIYKGILDFKGDFGGYADLLMEMHFPTSFDRLKAACKYYSLAEAINDVLTSSYIKHCRNEEMGPIIKAYPMADFFKSLDFELTPGQGRALDELMEDLLNPKASNRLLQGDVGSGKTVLAFAMAYMTMLNGFQVAMMAPTEVLASQHAKKAEKLFKSLGYDVYTVQGSDSVKKRSETQELAKNGKVGLFIGTHALISDGLGFSNLGLVITDEQHRFGVGQRAKLLSKSIYPNSLVLSATPIPRTLKLVSTGQLDLTRLKDKPLGRKKIETYLVNGKYEKRIYDFIEKKSKENLLSYLVCPRIEKGYGDLSYWSVDEVFSRCIKYFGTGVKVGKLTGPMSSEEKEEVISRFADGKLDLIIATSLIEVGIDVSRACIMVIVGAENFGLAQLHQLRGRVGRGSDQSYCILLSDSSSKASKERLRFLENCDDGFDIAVKDLELRGGGDIYGFEQHGFNPGTLDPFNKNSIELKNEAKKILTDKFGHEILERKINPLEFINTRLRDKILKEIKDFNSLSLN